MPYRIELASGRTETVSYPPEPDGWTCASHEPCADRVVKCERIEPKTETRWHLTYADRSESFDPIPPLMSQWRENDKRECVVSCERVEVEV